MRLTVVTCVRAAALAANLSASTLDISSRSSQTLHDGDSLRFLFSSSSYNRFAAQFGVLQGPTFVHFVLSSLPIGADGHFTAELESQDGTMNAGFSSPLTWTTGEVQSALYTGATSSISGSLLLADPIGKYSSLVLTYLGPEIDVGFGGYTLPHDLVLTVSGGPITVGAMVYAAEFATPDYQTLTAPQVSTVVAAPEPGGGLLLFAGAALCVLALFLRRLTHGGPGPVR